ncbi:MAG: hypothetical protein RL141_350, partial [Candidatus Parcubacteria bacterium]
MACGREVSSTIGDMEKMPALHAKPPVGAEGGYDASVERARNGFYDRFKTFVAKRPPEAVAMLALLMSAEGCAAAGIPMPPEALHAKTVERTSETGESALLEGLPPQEEMLAEIERVHGPKIRRGLFEIFQTRVLGIPLSGQEERPRPRTAPEEIKPGRPDVRLSYDIGLSRESLQEILEAGWPKSWIAPEVMAMEVSDFRERDDPEAMDPTVKGYLQKNHGHGVDASSIHISGERLIEWDASFGHLIGHEVAHANDAIRSNTLKTPERIALLYRVQQRALSPDRTFYPYAETMFRERDLIRGVREYWAEMMAAALAVPADDEAAWRRNAVWQAPNAASIEKDLDIVMRYLQVAAPGFKPWEAATQRVAVEGEIMRTTVRQRMDAALDVLPAG